MGGYRRIISITTIILACIAFDQVTKKNVTAKVSFKLTGHSLQNLKSKELPGDVINKLEAIKNQKIIGRENFLDTLTSTIGDEQIVRYKSLILDHTSATLELSIPTSYWGDFFRFHYAENTGAMLGFGADLPDGLRFWLLTVLVGVLLLVLLGYVVFNKKLTTVQTVALSLIAGGGLSNFIDRILNDGRVVDFMNMGIGWLRTGIFNFADVSIMVGLGLILVFGEWGKKEVPGERG